MFCQNKRRICEFLPRNLVYFEGGNRETSGGTPLEATKEGIPKQHLADTPEGRNQIRYRAQEFLKKHPENNQVKKLLFYSTQLEVQKNGEAESTAKELYSTLMSSPDATIMKKQEDTFNKPQTDRDNADQAAWDKENEKKPFRKPVD